MKILKEQLDLNRKFEIEVTLGELVEWKNVMERSWHRAQQLPSNSKEYKFYNQIKEITDKYD